MTRGLQPSGDKVYFGGGYFLIKGRTPPRDLFFCLLFSSPKPCSELMKLMKVKMCRLISRRSTRESDLGSSSLARDWSLETEWKPVRKEVWWYKWPALPPAVSTCSRAIVNILSQSGNCLHTGSASYSLRHRHHRGSLAERGLVDCASPGTRPFSGPSTRVDPE